MKREQSPSLLLLRRNLLYCAAFLVAVVLRGLPLTPTHLSKVPSTSYPSPSITLGIAVLAPQAKPLHDSLEYRYQLLNLSCDTNMSFTALSTELDTKIIEYMQPDRSALEAMSRVSKYYRGIAEPFLYRDLTFRAVHEIQIKRLLLTLLDRPELALFIRSFTLSDHLTYDSFDTGFYKALDNLAKRLLKYDTVIKNAIRTIPLPSSAAMHMFGSIFTRGGSIFRATPSLDGTIALLLCLASNVESIHLALAAPEYLDITREVLNGPWTNVKRDKPGQRPLFVKLRHLQLQGDGSTNQPGMGLCIWGVTPKLVIKTLKVCGIGSIMGTPDALRTLELRDVDIGAPSVEHLVRTCTCPNLTRLVLDKLRDRTHSWWQYDYSRLSAALIKHTHLLETLICTRLYYQVPRFSALSPRPPSSLRPLTKLHTLRVGIEILMKNSRKYEDFAGEEILPKSLKHLGVVMDINRHVGDLLDRGGRMAQLLGDPVRSIALETFDVIVHAGWWPENLDMSVSTLKGAVERAKARGLEYRALEWMKDEEEPGSDLLSDSKRVKRIFTYQRK